MSNSTASLQLLLDRLRSTPFPRLGKKLKEFPSFDAVIAGLAMRAVDGELVGQVPTNSAAAAFVAELETKKHLTAEERALKDYYALLEAIRIELR